MMARMENVEVVVAHQARATVRVGDVFLKIDAEQAHLDTEVAATALSPIPAPEVLWQQPSVLAIRAVTGVIDWSEAGRGDPVFDLATLTRGHPERLGDVLAGQQPPVAGAPPTSGRPGP